MKQDGSAPARRPRPPPAPRPQLLPNEWDGSPFGPIRPCAKQRQNRSRSIDAGKPPIILREEEAAARRARRIEVASIEASPKNAESQLPIHQKPGRSRSVETGRGNMCSALPRDSASCRQSGSSHQGVERVRVKMPLAAPADTGSSRRVGRLEKLPQDAAVGARAEATSRSSARSAPPRLRVLKQVRPTSSDSGRNVRQSTGGAGSSSAHPPLPSKLPEARVEKPAEKPPSVIRAEAAAVRRALCQPAKRRSASPSAQPADAGGLAEKGDAAALILRTMLGPRGSSEQFVTVINQWREKHPLTKYESHEQHEPLLDEFAQLPEATNGILVAARVRPLLPKGPDAKSLQAGDFEAVSVVDDSTEVVLHTCGVHRDGVSSHVDHKPIHLHAAYGGGCDGSLLFRDLMAPLLESAVAHSAHATAMCYGQTGSGKTHTQSYLIEQAARHLFDRLGASCIALEAFELTGSVAYSLQEDAKPELMLVEGRDGVVHVGVSRAEKVDGELPELCLLASNAEMLIGLFRAAACRRTAQDTDRNAASSRSHAFYRMYLVSEKEEESGTHRCSKEGTCIEMVDLAGSESNKDTLFHDRTRVEDAAKINSSLMALNDCIRKQSQGAGFVPFRADKLTLLLRPCFMKRLKAFKDVPTLLFIACLSPLASDTHQSYRTLSYAQQLSEMKARTRREAAEALKHRDAVGLKEWDASRAKPIGIRKSRV